MNVNIARRELELQHEDGTAGVVTVSIGAPEGWTDGAGYFCRIDIVGLEREFHLQGGGADPMQALVLSLRMIGVTLKHSIEAKQGRLTWQGKPDLGFPMD